ncbi:hypothetical protein ACTFIR_006071 [Dictyostelium discoideum]
MFKLLGLNPTKRLIPFSTTNTITYVNYIYKPKEFLKSYSTSSNNNNDNDNDGNENDDKNDQINKKTNSKKKNTNKILNKIYTNNTSTGNQLNKKYKVKTKNLNQLLKSRTTDKGIDTEEENVLKKGQKQKKEKLNSKSRSSSKSGSGGGVNAVESGSSSLPSPPPPPSPLPPLPQPSLASHIPKQVIVLPITDYVVFYGSYVQFPFSEAEYREMGSPTHLGLFLISDAEREVKMQEALKSQEASKSKSPSKPKSNFTTFSHGTPDLSKIHKVGMLATVCRSQGYLILGGGPIIQITGVSNDQDNNNNNNNSNLVEITESKNDTSDSEILSSTTTTTPSTSITPITTPVVPQIPTSKYLKVSIEPREYSEQGDTLTVRALRLQLAKCVHGVINRYQDSSFAQHLKQICMLPIYKGDDSSILNSIGPLCISSPSEYQKLLECKNFEEKLNMVLLMLVKKCEVFEFNFSIEKQLEEKTMAQQKKYFLTEQMKLIRKELGIDLDEKEAIKNKFNSRWKEVAVMDKQILQVFKEEMDKLSSCESNSSEYNTSRNYLDWMTLLPWNVYTNDNFDISKVKEVLDRDHYGLKDIKEMIQTFIAVGKLRGSIGGKVILLVGPPGTGKTSVGKSIANALGRQFHRISVGGLSDVSEIKGHRRTYVASMPGKIIQALKTVKTSNPVILIDEIDKISRSSQGDPNSALLEVLDPQQNKNFVDYYLDVPYDLSRVLFICTANDADSIPAPLLDRMEVMTLNGYIQSEQMEIAKHYLLPLVRKETGITEEQLQFTPEAIKKLCELYCREAGVRNLKKFIDKIFRKMAYKLSMGTEQSVIITPDNLEQYVGPIKYPSSRLFQKQKPGIVMGLGGSLIHIESALDRFTNGPTVTTTGSLGLVMRESIDISYSYVKDFLLKLDASNDYFLKNSIHIHAPDGSTQKDISSAGITIVSSLLSLATGKLVKPDLAMVGEVSLTGKVIGVSGIVEKIVLAKRESIKTIIIPKENKKQLEEIPDFIKEGIEIYLVDYYSDVYSIAFTNDSTIKPLIFNDNKENQNLNENEIQNEVKSTITQ